MTEKNFWNNLQFGKNNRKLKNSDKENLNPSNRNLNYLSYTNDCLTENKIKEIININFKKYHGYNMNWEHPLTFNQKIMWLKLNYQNPLIAECCDKFAVKEYVSNIIGKEYVVPVIDWWTNPDDIDFDKLPNSFVLKVNWSSGFNIIVPDKSKINIKEIKEKLELWVQPSSNSYFELFNWGYKYLSPIIYAEEYISEINDSSQIYDYKFYCYEGVCKNLFITTDRFSNKTYNWFDADFNELPFTWGKAGKTKGGVKKPKHFKEMIKIAEKLSKPFPFVRVDFYEVGDKIYVGEMTFYPGGGVLKFNPIEYDFILGENINLPKPIKFDELTDYEKMDARDAYYAEDKISIEEKVRYCEKKGLAELLYFPNLKDPKSFNEKLLWLAIYYKNPLISTLTDKYELKEYLKNTIGEEYVVPTIGCYTDPNDINWEKLPEKFVIKSNCGWSGKQVKIITNKKYENEDIIKGTCSSWLNPWSGYRYNNMCITDEKIKPRIIIEKLIGDGKNINDYKFYSSYGETKMVLVVSNRGESNQANTFLNPKTWELYPVRRYNKHVDKKVKKPKNINKMIEIAEKISKEFPLVRVDFYEINNKIYVGEVSFNPGLFIRFIPTSFDYKIGDFINLDKVKKDIEE